MGEVKVTELKKFLASLNEVQLKGEITELFKLFPAVKEYYKVKLDPAGEKDILEKYKPDNLRSIEMKRSENHYNEQERRVNEFIIRCGGKDDSEIEDAWCEYLEENLQFPFSAEIIDDPGPLEVGDIIKVTDIEGIFDLYGIVVNARLGRKKYSFPLCLLELVEKNSKNFQLVDDYNLWFSNR